MKKLGLTMQYPEGYLESQANGKGSSEEEEEDHQSKKRGKKRKSIGQLWSALRSPFPSMYLPLLLPSLPPPRLLKMLTALASPLRCPSSRDTSSPESRGH